MGQKANVISLHLMQNKNWNSFWYADHKIYSLIFREDFSIYLYLRAQSKLKYNILRKKYVYNIEIVKSCIYRAKKNIILNLQLVCLKKEKIKVFVVELLKNIKRFFNYEANNFLISYKIEKKAAYLVGIKIAILLEKRVRFQSKTVKTLIKKIPCAGIRVSCKGRLNFRDRAKKSQIVLGSVPLQTINANIDYSCIIANTAKGLQSVKVWIYLK